jgi:hypothetical protein
MFFPLCFPVFLLSLSFFPYLFVSVFHLIFLFMFQSRPLLFFSSQNSLFFIFFPKNPPYLLLSSPIFVFWFSPCIYRRLGERATLPCPSTG